MASSPSAASEAPGVLDAEELVQFSSADLPMKSTGLSHAAPPSVRSDGSFEERIVTVLFPDDDLLNVQGDSRKVAAAGEECKAAGTAVAAPAAECVDKAAAPCEGRSAAVTSSTATHETRASTRVAPGQSTDQRVSRSESQLAALADLTWNSANRGRASPGQPGTIARRGRTGAGMMQLPAESSQQLAQSPSLGSLPPLVSPSAAGSQLLPSGPVLDKTLRRPQKRHEPAKYDCGDGRVRLRGVRSTSDLEQFAGTVPLHSRKGFEVRNAFKAMRTSQHAAVQNSAWSALHSLRAADMPIDSWYSASKDGARFKRW